MSDPGEEILQKAKGALTRGAVSLPRTAFASLLTNFENAKRVVIQLKQRVKKLQRQKRESEERETTLHLQNKKLLQKNEQLEQDNKDSETRLVVLEDQNEKLQMDRKKLEERLTKVHRGNTELAGGRQSIGKTSTCIRRPAARAAVYCDEIKQERTITVPVPRWRQQIAADPQLEEE